MLCAHVNKDVKAPLQVSQITSKMSSTNVYQRQPASCVYTCTRNPFMKIKRQ